MAQFDARQLIGGATDFAQGIWGTPEGLLNKRKFELSQDQDAFKRQNAMALGSAFGDSIRPAKGRAYVTPNELPLPELAMTGQLGDASPLVRAFNEPAIAKLNLSPYNADRLAYIESGGDPTQMRAYDAARLYATTNASEDKRRDFGLETDKVRDQRGIFDVNASPYAAALRILNDPNLAPEQKQEQIDIILRFQKASGIGTDPEARAKAELNKERLRFETGITPLPAGQTSIAQAEQDLKTEAKIREDEASARFGQTYFNRSTAPGALGYNLTQAGVGPMDQAQFEGNEKIRVEREIEAAKAKSANELARIKASTPDVNTQYGLISQAMGEKRMSPQERLEYETNEKIRLADARARADFEYPNNPTAGKLKAFRDANISPEGIAASFMDALIIPKGSTAVLPPNDPRLAAVRDRSAAPEDNSALWRIPQIQQGMTPMQAFKSMSREELLEYNQNDPEAFKALYTAIKPPASGTVIRDGNILSRTEYKPVPPEVDKELRQLNDSLAQLDRAIEAVSEKGAENSFGYKRGAQSKIPDMLGGTTFLEEGIGPEGIARRAVLFDPIARTKHEIYGAALTGGERIDARNFLPSEFDNAKSAKEKLTQLRDRVASVIESRLNTFNNTKGFDMLQDSERSAELIQKFTEDRAKKRAEKEGAKKGKK